MRRPLLSRSLQTMDRVPFVFCEKVLAMWKCCDSVGVALWCHCIRPTFADLKWTLSSKTHKIAFFLAIVNGTWKYGFEDPDDYCMFLSLDELKRNAALSNVQICKIRIFRSKSPVLDSALKLLSDDLSRLLNFVSYLANKPALLLETELDDWCGSAEFLAWLERRWFGCVKIDEYRSTYNRLLEYQFLRKNPADLYIDNIKDGAEFLEEQIRIGNLRRLMYCGDTGFCCSSRTVRAVVERFLQNPSTDISICVQLDNEAQEMLRDMEKRGLCRCIRYVQSKKLRYEFGRGAVRLLLGRASGRGS